MLLLACLVAAVPVAWAEGCATVAPTGAIDVAVDQAPVSLQRVQGARLQAGYVASSRHHVGGRVLGSTGFDVRTMGHLGTARQDGDAACTWLASARITVTLRQQIRLDRRYRPGSCEASQIRRHEDRHVAINRDAFQSLRPAVIARLQDGLAPLRRMPRSTAALEAAVDMEFRALTRWVVDEMGRLTRARHQALDTPTSYRRWLAACSHW